MTGIKAVAIVIALLLLCAGPASAQLRSRTEGLARSQVVMVRASGSCAGGILVGHDDARIYLVTAAHLVGASRTIPAPVDVQFDGLTRSSRGAIVKMQPEPGDLALVTVDLDADLRTFLGRIDFTILSPVGVPPANSPVHSIGCSGGSFWSTGNDETLLAPEGTVLRFRSTAVEGQSGGALYTEAWELIGMAMTLADNIVRARPIESIIETVRTTWQIPVRLAPRAADDRVRGADELVRETTANLFAERAGRSRADNDALAAMSFVAEARSHIVTPLVRAEALLVPEPALVARYSVMPTDANGHTAIALSPAGDIVAIGSADGSVRFLSTATGAVLRRLPGVSRPIVSLAFSKDATVLAAGFGAAENQPVDVALWKSDGTEAPRRIALTNMFGGEVLSVVFASAARLIGLNSAGSAFVIDLAAGTELWRQRHALKFARSLTRLSDTEYFAAGPGQSAIVTFQNDAFTVGAVPGCTVPPRGFVRPVFGPAAFIPSPVRVLARTCGARLLLSDERGQAERAATGHSDELSEVTRLGTLEAIVTGAWDGTVRVWDAATGRELARSGLHRGGIRRLVTSDRGDVIVALEEDSERFRIGGGVRVWSYRADRAVTYAPAPTLNMPPAAPRQPGPPPAPPALPPGPLPFCWRDGEQLHTFRRDIVPGATGLTLRRDCRLAAVAFMNRLALYRPPAGSGGWTMLAETPITGLERTALAGAADVVAWVEPQPGAPGARIRVWAPPAPPVTVVDVSERIVGFGISDDGTRVAVYELAGLVRVWDQQSVKPILERGHPTGVPADLVFGPGETLLVTTGIGIESWSLTGATTQTFPVRGASTLAGLGISADGALAVVRGRFADDDGPRRILVFDLRRRLLLATALLPRVAFNVTLSPGGDRLLIDYGRLSQDFGVRTLVDVGVARGLTGQRWNRTALSPDP